MKDRWRLGWKKKPFDPTESKHTAKDPQNFFQKEKTDDGATISLIPIF